MSKNLLKIEKYRCRYCGAEFNNPENAHRHSMLENHFCDALPKLPLEYE